MGIGMDNYYKLLEIEKGAKKEEIRRAFCRLAKKYHPDVSAGNGDFVRMIDAYRTLMDDEKRKKYNDKFTESPGRILLPKNRISYAVSLKDIAQPPAACMRKTVHCHGGRTFSGRRTVYRRYAGRMVKGYDVCVSLSSSELLRGAAVRIDVPAHVICPLCGGSRMSCTLCADRGHVTRAVPVIVEIPYDLKNKDVFRVSLREKKKRGYVYFITDKLFVMVDVTDD
jgi:DnaJ-class molecular chaperone